MAYSPLQTPRFARTRKKLPQALARSLDAEVKKVCADPTLGDAKKGDLQGVRFQKFSLLGQVYLLAYWTDERAKEVTLLSIGGHENFYRDLKHYAK